LWPCSKTATAGHFLDYKYVMTANTIPGTQTTPFGIVITDIKIFYSHAERTIDLVEMRRLWIDKQLTRKDQ